MKHSGQLPSRRCLGLFFVWEIVELSTEWLGVIRHAGPAGNGEGITCKGSLKIFFKLFLASLLGVEKPQWLQAQAGMTG